MPQFSSPPIFKTGNRINILTFACECCVQMDSKSNLNLCISKPVYTVSQQRTFILSQFQTSWNSWWEWEYEQIRVRRCEDWNMKTEEGHVTQLCFGDFYWAKGRSFTVQATFSCAAPDLQPCRCPLAPFRSFIENKKQFQITWSIFYLYWRSRFQFTSPGDFMKVKIKDCQI